MAETVSATQEIVAQLRVVGFIACGQALTVLGLGLVRLGEQADARARSVGR